MHWRTRFLLESLRVFFLPPLILRAALTIAHINVRSGWSPILYLSSVALYINLYDRYWYWYSQREATKRGVRPIPIAHGKWIGNIDLLLRVMRTPGHAYVGQPIHEIMLEHRTNTINIRPLWSDLIFTADEMIMKEMLATGFGVWEKGRKQRELLYSFFGSGIFNVDGKEWMQVCSEPLVPSSKLMYCPLAPRNDPSIPHQGTNFRLSSIFQACLCVNCSLRYGLELL